ncbi:MAG: hypothetical protein HYZ25_18360 [Chloroflexi bacterium]|nr:hypothetical protein [Chloroflexota bacterium]
MIKNRGLLRAFGILALTAIYLAACTTTPSPSTPSPMGDTINFDDLSPNTVYHVNDTFTSVNATLSVLPFYWRDKTSHNDGSATVIVAEKAGGTGNEIMLNNVNLGFDVGSLECITLRFFKSGGNVNLVINQDKGNFDEFQDTNVGGVDVSVAYDSNTNYKGTITLRGKFEKFVFQEKWSISFAIGGQELWLDDIGPCR